MIEKIFQKALVFHGIDYGALAMHLFQVIGNVRIELNVLEEPIKKPRKKKSGLLVKLERVEQFFTIRFHDRFEIISSPWSFSACFQNAKRQ